ncbi:cysteine hydrolase [Candidatus Bathyarchaeota archaeon]|nr:cysteine hydrolase [Candidatus Bathyarchaeota archaeon]
MEAVLVVDMLRDFVSGKLRCERARRIIPNLMRLLSAARRHDIPVIYLNDAHLPVDFELRRWGEHAMRGTEGAEVVPELGPVEGDYVLEKRTYSGFYETGLDPLLRGLGVDTLVLTGIHTHLCVRHTAADAFFRGYRIVVPRDGTEAFTEEAYREGLRYMEEFYGAEVTEVDKLVKRWGEEGPETFK